MIYKGFAGVYDHLMEDVPYREWADLIDRLLQQHAAAAREVLDLACGTGEITVLLQEKGYRMSGADLSGDMLSLAMQKAEERKMEISFFEQDMREMVGHDERFDAVLINCDSLNYLLEEKDVQKALNSVHRMLRIGGLLLFDVHSPYKMEHILTGSTFADAREEVSLIWQCFSGEHPLSAEHELTFFVKKEDGSYDRLDEFHQQRTYLSEDLLLWAKESGFELLENFADFKPGMLHEEAERLFFIFRKN